MFRKDAPFKYAAECVYGNLDDMHVKIAVMEEEMQGLADSASLFEVNMPEFKQLKGCRREVKLLKVSFSFDVFRWLEDLVINGRKIRIYYS